MECDIYEICITTFDDDTRWSAKVVDSKIYQWDNAYYECMIQIEKLHNSQDESNKTTHSFIDMRQTTPSYIGQRLRYSMMAREGTLNDNATSMPLMISLTIIWH